MGFRVDGQETRRDPEARDDGTAGLGGDWHIDDIEGVREPLVGDGAEIHSPTFHVKGGGSVATLADQPRAGTGPIEDTA